MIYFDENKKPFGSYIENSIATIDDETWMLHAGKDDWDIVDGMFVDLSNSPEYIQSQKDELIGTIMDEQIAVLTQFDITWSRNVVLGKKTMAQMETARDALKQSYADRINEVQNG